MATVRRSGSRLGLLGLGGYGLGLCAIGVAGIVTPLLQARADSGADPGDLLARPSTGDGPGSGGGLQVDLEAGGGSASALFAAAAIRPLVTPAGVVGSTAGVPRAGAGDRATAPEFRPTLVVLPSGRTAQIKPVGLRSDGSLAVPDDPKQLGWWDGGSQAGEPFGSTVVAGHVDSLKFGLGALAELGRAHHGDLIELRADGHRQRYRVTGIQRIPQALLTSRTSAFRQDVAHRLVVITCGGPFDRGRHRYLDNVVVTAVPIR